MLWLSVLWGCTAGSVRVELPDASGLAPGARVWAMGMDVGEVRSVQLDGDRVSIDVSIDTDQDLALHADACAVVIPETPPTLQLWPGTEGSLSGPVEACRITREDLESFARSAGETVSGVAREFAVGLGLDRLLPGTDSPPPLPPSGPRSPSLRIPLPEIPKPSQPHAPMPPGRGIALPDVAPMVTRELCSAIDVVVERIETVQPNFFLPDGGYALTLGVTNRNPVDIELPSVTHAVLVAGGREFSPNTAPDPRNWFMPMALGAGASRSLRLVVGAELARGGGTLDGIRIAEVSPEGDPFSECAVSASFVSR